MSVFSKPDKLVNRNRVVFPEFDYLQRNLQSNTSALERHIANRVIAIPNDNLIGQILYAMPLRDEGESEPVYYERLAGLSIGKFTAFGIVNEASHGRVTEGAIYSEVSEYFIATESEYKVRTDDMGINIISHPFIGNRLLNFTNVEIVDRIKNPREYFAYFTIDLPLLVLNYNRFVEKQQSNLKEGESLGDTIGDFIRSKLLPSLVSQHLDLVFVNRLTRLLTGEQFIRTKGLTDISLAEFDDKTDDILEEYLDYITAQITSIEQVLALELPSGRMFWDVLLEREDKLQLTNWFYYMANYRYYSFLIIVLALTGLSNENDDVGKFRYDINNLKNFRDVIASMDDETKAQYNKVTRGLEGLIRDV